MLIQICVGSSCCLKGSYDIVELAKQAIEQHKLDSEIALAGSFCTGRCNRVGVTITVDDEVHTGITKENFDSFFKEHVLSALEGTKK